MGTNTNLTRPESRLNLICYSFIPPDPVDVTITTTPGTDVREGDPVTLTCVTSGGNPQTIDEYSWSYKGQMAQNGNG
jgi:hypothetical protein